jgi:hypothetical protein
LNKITDLKSVSKGVNLKRIFCRGEILKEFFLGVKQNSPEIKTYLPYLQLYLPGRNIRRER